MVINPFIRIRCVGLHDLVGVDWCRHRTLTQINTHTICLPYRLTRNFVSCCMDSSIITVWPSIVCEDIKGKTGGFRVHIVTALTVETLQSIEPSCIKLLNNNCSFFHPLRLPSSGISSSSYCHYKLQISGWKPCLAVLKGLCKVTTITHMRFPHTLRADLSLGQNTSTRQVIFGQQNITFLLT